MKTRCFMVLVMSSCVFSLAPESISVKVGDSVPLHTGVSKQQHQTIMWHFNGTRIALLNGDARQSCLYDGEGGTFRDRLEVDYGSGSLTIKNITTEHTGRYEAEIIRSESAGTSQSLNRKPKCDGNKDIPKTNNLGDTIKTLFVSVSDPEKTNETTKKDQQDSDKSSGLPAGAVAGICVAVLLIVAAVGFVICYYQKNMYKRAANEKQDEDVV